MMYRARVFGPLRGAPNSIFGGASRAIRPNPIGKRFYIPTADWKPVKSGKKPPRKSVVILLVLMPIISFALGTWQVRRLKWKQDLIANAETQLIKPPLDAPAHLNPNVVKEFDFRPIRLSGTWDHRQEMLVGPRLRDGKSGYYLVTPLVRPNGSTLLVNRGWIDKAFLLKASRPDSLVTGPVTINCLLRQKPKRNYFTKDGRPELGDYHFMDIDEMAKRTGAQPIYIEQLVDPKSNVLPEQQIMHGVPVGFPSKVEFRNTHFQYIVTWYGLGILTTVMLLAVVRQNRNLGVAEPLRAKLAHAKKWQ